MKRKIIEINEVLCNGCGACADACHEGAIKIINGKAKLIRDDYCDGLGDCLPVCPGDAIHFIEREAPAYNADAVATAQRQKVRVGSVSRLSQWPVQMKLVNTRAPYLDGANLLIAADCTAYAYAGFHEDFIKGHITLVGCPKLDSVDYSEKLTEILKNNNIKNITVVRMEVPCCGGIENAVKTALLHSQKMIPWQVFTISTEGKLLE